MDVILTGGVCVTIFNLPDNIEWLMVIKCSSRKLTVHKSSACFFLLLL